MDVAQSQLEKLIADHGGLDHILVKRRGKSCTLYSETPHGPDLHAKFDPLGRNVWRLSLPTHTGRWEKTPFIGSMDEVVQVLTQMLGSQLDYLA